MGQVSNAKADMIFGVMYKAAHSPKARRKAPGACKVKGGNHGDA
jgi:hypothetical protein